MFDVKSIKTCLMCGTAPMSEASEMDAKLLKVAQDKQPNRQTNKQTDSLSSPPSALVGGRAGPTQAAPSQENTSFSAADLSTFKASKQRKMALAARSGIKDKRPLPEDKNRPPCQAQGVFTSGQGHHQDPENVPSCRQQKYRWPSRSWALSEGFVATILRGENQQLHLSGEPARNASISFT